MIFFEAQGTAGGSRHVVSKLSSCVERFWNVLRILPGIKKRLRVCPDAGARSVFRIFFCDHLLLMQCEHVDGCAECLLLLGSLQGPSVTSSDSRIVERSGINGALSWTERPLDMLSRWQMRKIFRQRARRSNQAVKSSRNPVHDVGLLEVYSEPFMGPKHFGIDSPLSVWGASGEASFEFRWESTNISVFPACCDARAWSFFRSLLGIHNFFSVPSVSRRGCPWAAIDDRFSGTPSKFCSESTTLLVVAACPDAGAGNVLGMFFGIDNPLSVCGSCMERRLNLGRN